VPASAASSSCDSDELAADGAGSDQDTDVDAAVSRVGDTDSESNLRGEAWPCEDGFVFPEEVRPIMSVVPAARPTD